ncbi:MAG: signal recognition particle-docking protein FtsY [Actinomycetota bacterium]
MPAGIVPELLVVLALLVLVAAVVVIRWKRPPSDTGPSSRGDLETIERVRDVEVRPPAAEPEVIEDAIEAPVEVPPVPARPSLRDRLLKSRRFLADRLTDALGRGPAPETWDDIEAALIQADVGVEAATRIVEDLKEKARERKTTESQDLRTLLADELVSLFADRDRSLVLATGRPTVWMIVGVNGTGKTTTIGKLAFDLTARGKTVALAASDTFRAAADEQLSIWGERTGADVIKHQQGADPGAVAFDAYQHARARSTDVLIVDTAGRLHTKVPLMDELAKVRRVIEKEGHVDESLLVIDATGGQNGLAQAREFALSAGVSGVVLTKLDGTAKGGIALTIEDTLGIPIKLIGIGEAVGDLEPFDPKTYVDALLS